MSHPQDRLVLPPDPGSIAAGRRWAAAQAERAHADDEVARVLELLTSELLTNAVVHTGATTPIRVVAEHGEDYVRVAVTDPDTTLPVVRPPSATRPGGNGMRIVAALADRWGVDVHPGVGKTVWFEARVATSVPARQHLVSA